MIEGMVLLYFIILLYFILFYREGKGEGRSGGETLFSCLLARPQLGTKHATQACAQPGIDLVTFRFVGQCPTN